MDFTVEEAKGLFDRWVLNFKKWQFGNKKQLAFLEDLHLLIRDGIPANRAVEMMGQISTGLTREVSISLAQKIAQGQALASGMREWFAPDIVEIIRVGEEGGALAETMASAINTLGRQGVAVGSLIGAVTYPLFVITIACFVMVYLKNAVFTQFEAIKPPSAWPESGRRLVAIASFIESYWWLALLAILLLILFIRRTMTSYVGDLRPELDKIPPFLFYRRFVSARFLETIGLLVANGVVFKSAIKIMQHNAKPYLLSHLISMEHLLSMGKTNIADVFNTGLIDPKDLMRLRVMAEVKGIEHGLIRMGVLGAEQTTKTLKFIARVIGGILLLTGGVMVLIIVQGIFETGMAMGG